MENLEEIKLISSGEELSAITTFVTVDNGMQNSFIALAANNEIRVREIKKNKKRRRRQFIGPTQHNLHELHMDTNNRFTVWMGQNMVDSLCWTPIAPLPR